MDDQVYTISQAAKEVGESTSVLRYWEEVLEIRVNRNQKGYRCYTGYDIQLFLNIKELKKRGLKLEAIKEFIPIIYQYGPGAPRSKTRLLEESGEIVEELTEIREIPIAQEIQEPQDSEIVWEAKEGQAEEEMAEKKEEKREIPLPMGGHLDDFRITEFQNILEKLIAQGVKEKNQEELRIRKLDEKIRFHQQGLKQVAAAQEMKQRRGKRNKRRKK